MAGKQRVVRQRGPELWLQEEARVTGSRWELFVTLSSSLKPHPNQDIFPTCMALFFPVLHHQTTNPFLVQSPSSLSGPNKLPYGSVLTKVLELGPV